MRILEIMPDFLNQKELEKVGNERGKHRTNKRRLSHIEREDESVTSYGKVLVANLIRPYAEAISEWVEQASSNVHSKTPIALQKISQIEDPKVTALIALKHIMNTITTTKNLTATAIKLGGRIETEISLKNFKNLNPELYAVVKKDLDKRSFNYAYKRRKYREVAKKDEIVSWEEWSTTERLHTGMQLITLMVDSVGLIEIGTDQHKHKTFKVIRQTAFTKKWIQDRNSFNELLNPEYLPMVLAPKSVVDGQVQGHGYWTSEMPELDLVKQRGKKFTNELENHDMPEVTSAVNLMQSTAYRINTFILEVMQNAWDKSLSIGGMPPIENLDIPQKPYDIDTNKEALFEYKKACVIVHTENNRMSSKRMLYAKIINLAEQYS